MLKLCVTLLCHTYKIKGSVKYFHELKTTLHLFVMLEFGYCIWLQPSKPSELYDLTDGFEPHISLQTNMKYDEANKIFAQLSATPLTIKIIDTPYITECEGFYALAMTLKFYRVYRNY